MKKLRRLSLVLAFSAVASFGSAHAPAQERQPFDVWLEEMRQEAITAGISEAIVNQALSDIEVVERAIKLDRNQPTKKWTFEEYREKIVHPLRIKRGREMMTEHREELEEISERFGVAPQYIVALWGIETNYGSNTGGFDIVPALATMAWEGRRGDFFRKELLTALRILDEGHIALENMKGSWAGAMGQNQFMPSSFEELAIDGDGDGKKDIWNNLSDVFASTANYLTQRGWNEGERWGREVEISDNITEDMIDLKTTRSLAEWSELGVTLPNGDPIPVAAGMEASLVAPDGIGGATYLVYNNYKTIMRWNRSTYFATSVGLLANAIAN